MSIKPIDSPLKELTPFPSLEDLCKQALSKHLQKDIATLRAHPRLSLDEALAFVGRKAEYRKVFKQGAYRESYLEYCQQVKALRQNYLPLRAMDSIRPAIKQSWNQRPESLRKYIDLIEKEPSAKKEALKKLEGQFVQQAKEHEKAASLASRINCLHGTNSSLLALIDKSDYTMIPTGKLLDRGIAVMSGEISKGGMERNGVNQNGISCDTIEGISRCWEYASKISHSFQAPNEEEFIEQFTKGLEQLKETSPDSDYWDPCIVSFLRLKQWNPELFQKLYVEHLKDIEEIKRNCLSKASHEEMRLLKALDYPLEKLIQAAFDEELCKQINEELGGGPWVRVSAWGDKSYGGEFGDKNLYSRSSPKSFRALTGMNQQNQHTFRQFQLRSDHVNDLIKKIIGFRINAVQVLANYEQRRKNPDYEIAKVEKQIGDISGPLTAEKILQKMIREKIEPRIRQNMKPFEKRYQRFLQVFSPADPIVKIDDIRRQILTKPYSMLLASTKIKPIRHRWGSEYNIPQARLGSEIDVMFVPEENIQPTQDWLKTHHLDKQVAVFPATLVKEIEELPLPLIHSSTQVVETTSSLDIDQQRNLNAILNEHVFPLYARPYPDGSKREYHDISHAVRVVLFSICLMELYHVAGKKVKTLPGNLQIAAGSHDCARENDGVDLWDKQSGEECTRILKKLNQGESEAEFLGRCVAEKDEPTEDVEQRNIHDSDCLEIMRCLCDPRGFDANQLWALKDLDPDTVYRLIKEAREFIKLTEQLPIKRFLSKAKEPYKVLLQILHITRERFPLIYSLNGSGIDAFADPSQYILTEEIASLLSPSSGVESFSFSMKKVREEGKER